MAKAKVGATSHGAALKAVESGEERATTRESWWAPEWVLQFALTSVIKLELLRGATTAMTREGV